MQAGEGYFVSNRTTGMLYLVLDPLDVFKPTVPSAPSYTALAPGTPTPPSPPGAALGGSSSSGCGGLGLEAFLLLLGWRAFHRIRRRRKLVA